MKEAEKRIVRETEVKKALDLGDKSRQKIKNASLVKVILNMMRR